MNIKDKPYKAHAKTCRTSRHARHERHADMQDKCALQYVRSYVYRS